MKHKKETNGSRLEITDEDREEMAHLVKQGYTSGRIDKEDGKRITWDLTTTIWENN